MSFLVRTSVLWCTSAARLKRSEDTVPTSSDKQCWNIPKDLSLVPLDGLSRASTATRTVLHGGNPQLPQLQTSSATDPSPPNRLLWKLLTWWSLWCPGIFCRRIPVHSIPRQFHTQWRKGQILGPRRPSQSCQSIGKKILSFRLRRKLLLSSVPEFSFSP